MPLRTRILLAVLVFTCGASALILTFLIPQIEISQGIPISIRLTRGTMTVADFPSQQATTKALILFASGDGGWSGFEEGIAHALQERGYEVAGIDSDIYATTDYDLPTLQADYGKIAAQMQAAQAQALPLIVGGYSMGAAQAIAVGGGPHPPAHLRGLLLVDPCARGRYGLRFLDRMCLLPTGPGTFAVASFASSMGTVRVLQWHAEEDEIDSDLWLDSLPNPHQLRIFPHTGHTYHVGSKEFIRQLAESAVWLLDADQLNAAQGGPGR